MRKIAYPVGIGDYPGNALPGSPLDANKITELLQYHGIKDKTTGDQIVNFEIWDGRVDTDTERINDRLRQLFAMKSTEIDTALFYFSGHGHVENDKLYLVGKNGVPGKLGVCVPDLLKMADNSDVPKKIFILDCCFAGKAVYDGRDLANIGRNTIVMAACREGEYAKATVDMSIFTGLLTNALEGSAADVMGQVTMAGLHVRVTETMSKGIQSPVFVGNVHGFDPIRLVEPMVERHILKRACGYFPTWDYHYELHPSFDPEYNGIQDDGKKSIYADIKKLERAGLLLPDKYEFIHYEVKNGGSCSLTPLGRHYWLMNRNGLL